MNMNEYWTNTYSNNEYSFRDKKYSNIRIFEYSMPTLLSSDKWGYLEHSPWVKEGITGPLCAHQWYRETALNFSQSSGGYSIEESPPVDKVKSVYKISPFGGNILIAPCCPVVTLRWNSPPKDSEKLSAVSQCHCWAHNGPLTVGEEDGWYYGMQ